MGRHKLIPNPIKRAEIYALFHPVTGEKRYIGKANDSRKRLVTHISEARRLNRPVHYWIRKLQSEGLQPGICVLEIADNWIEAERRLIAKYLASGARLLNIAEGGDQPHCTKETRSANGYALNARLKEDSRMAFIRYAKIQLSIAKRNGHLSENTKAKMRRAAQINPRLFGDWATI